MIDSPFFHIPCIFKHLTGIPCPGCGTLRALQLLLQGDVVGSLRMNPLGLLLVVLAVVCVVWYVVDLWTGRHTLYKAFHTRLPNYTIVIAVLLTFANWMWNISKGL